MSQSTIEIAATCVVLRPAQPSIHGFDYEVLLLQRNPAMKSSGGIWVFPGGKLDPEDHGRTEQQRARRAAVREAAEETNLSLKHEELILHSHWTTPPTLTRRFATWFYMTAHVEEVQVDGSEITDHRWHCPAQALAEAAQNNMTLFPPTARTIEWLQAFTKLDQALDAARQTTVYKYEPTVVNGGALTVNISEIERE